MLRDWQTQVVKRKRRLLSRITFARTVAAQAIQFVKGRFFGRIRAFADSLNTPPRMTDDNGAEREPVGEEAKRTALKLAGLGQLPGFEKSRVVAKVLAMEPLVASRWMVRAALVGIR